MLRPWFFLALVVGTLGSWLGAASHVAAQIPSQTPDVMPRPGAPAQGRNPLAGFPGYGEALENIIKDFEEALATLKADRQRRLASAKPIKPIQQRGKTPRDNLDAIAREVAALLPSIIQEVAAEFPILVQGASGIRGGTIEFAGMTGPHEAKITLVLDDQSRENKYAADKSEKNAGPGSKAPSQTTKLPVKLAVVSIQLRHFDGYWVTVGYDCTWNKLGTPSASWTDNGQVAHDNAYRDQGKNMVVLLLMAHIDKRP